jgi:hypothetical protein
MRNAEATENTESTEKTKGKMFSEKCDIDQPHLIILH